MHRSIASATAALTIVAMIAADRFTPHVGEDYEGIAMIQRAAILRHDADAAPSDGAAKK